jgi:hypothetical protein
MSQPNIQFEEKKYPITERNTQEKPNIDLTKEDNIIQEPVVSQPTEATIRRLRKGIDFWKETVGERQSTRQAKRPIRPGADDDEAYYTDTTINDTPIVEEALAGPQREKWLEAMENERQQLRRYGMYTLTNLSPTDKAIDTKRVLLIKQKSGGSIKKYKARKVAWGFSQMPGMHYDETFAPIARTETWKLILLHSTQRSCKRCCLDPYCLILCYEQRWRHGCSRR